MTSTILFCTLFITILISSARGGTLPRLSEETCIDLCSSCEGVAKYNDGNCECNIPDNVDEGTECLGRMKRQADEYGLHLVSCDLNDDRRSTRCTLGSKHSHAYGKNDIDQVAKYFMQDGPMTGSVFIAPPYTQQLTPFVGKSADCTVGAARTIITQPVETMPEQVVSSSKPATVSSPHVGSTLITQPKEFMPIDSVPSTPSISGHSVGASLPKLAGTPLHALGSPFNPLGMQDIAPRFLSMLGEVLTKPILSLPDAIQSVSRTPGVSDLVGAPANLLNSLADQLAEKSATAKENLDNFREVVGKAKDDVKVGLSKLKQSTVELASPTVGSSRSMPSIPTYTMMNPAHYINFMNPPVGSPLGQLVGAPAPTQYISAPAPTHLVSAPAPTHLVSAPAPTHLVSAPAPTHIVSSPAQTQLVGASAPTQLVSAPAPMQIVGTALPAQLLSAAQLVSAALPSQSPIVGSTSSSGCGGQMVGSPASSFSSQLVGASAPMVSAMPLIQSLGTIPLSSIVSQISPTYLVGSPMTYYPAVQSSGMAEQAVADTNPEFETLEEVPLSSPPKKICKKSIRDQPSMKFTRDVKDVEESKEQPEEKIEMTTTTTTTELPMIDRTTTQKPKEKTKADKSVIGKIKPANKKTKTERNVDRKL